MILWTYMAVGALCGAVAAAALLALELGFLASMDLAPAGLALPLAGILLAGGVACGAVGGAALALVTLAGRGLSGRLGRGGPHAWAALVVGVAALPAMYALAHALSAGRQAAAIIGNAPARSLLALGLAVGAGALFWICLAVARRLASARSPAWAVVAALALLLLAGGLFVADATLYRRLYFYLHAVLQGAAFAAACLAVLCAARCLPWRWPRPGRLALAALAVAVGCGLFGAWGRATLARDQRLRFAALELTATAAKLLALAPLSSRVESPQFLGQTGRRPTSARGVEHRVPGANVVWVTVDALRPDHLGCYGYSRPTSPNIDALAARSVRFNLAYCQTPLTCYSVPSLHTGDYLRSTLPMLPTPPPTLARVLGARGYQTSAFYNASIFFCDDRKATSYGDRQFGFRYAETAHRDAEDLTDRVLAHLQERVRAGDERLFLWVHYFDVHEPYRRNKEHDFGPRPVDRYDSEIARVDRALGRLVAALAALNRPTIFVLTADHGEEFKEHGGNYHGSSLYDEQVKVPLIIGVPGLKPRVISTPAQLVDVAPTMLKLLGLPVPASMRGRSLVGELLGRADPERAAFAEVHTKKMVRYRDWKLIHDYRRSTNELYDLRGDPQERRNLIGRRPREADQMKARLDGWFDALRASAAGTGIAARPAGVDLGRIGDRRSVPLLSRLMLDPAAQTRWRQEAARLLGQLQDRRAADALWRAVADDDARVGAEAAIALGEMKDKRARLVLPRVLGHSLDNLRMRGAIAMARVDGAEASPALVEALYSGNWELQNRAAHYLGFLGDRRAIEPLLRAGALGHLRSRTALALGRLGRRVPDQRIRGHLLQVVLEGRKVDTRQRALAGLGYLGDPRAAKKLVSLLGRSPELTWLPETLARLGSFGRQVTGLDVNPRRRGLRGGWGACSQDRSSSSDRYNASTWCTVTGARAALDIVARRRPAGGRLRVHLRPLGRPSRPLRVSLKLNGRTLGGGDLSGGWQTVAVAAPRAVWRQGRNRLTMAFQPGEGGGDGGVAVDHVLLAPLAPPDKNKPMTNPGERGP